MNPIKGVAIVLIAAGVAGLAYGGFTYTKETHEGHLGPIELTVKDQRTVNVKAYLEAQGIAESRITTKGFGKSQPIASNDTAEGRATNRRVMIIEMP